MPEVSLAARAGSLGATSMQSTFKLPGCSRTTRCPFSRGLHVVHTAAVEARDPDMACVLLCTRKRGLFPSIRDTTADIAAGLYPDWIGL